MGKKILKTALIILTVILVLALGLIIYLSATEYKPRAVEKIPVSNLGTGGVPGETMTLLSWNIGYSGLGAGADFVLDGGSSDGKPDSEEEFKSYYDGILETLKAQKADVYLLQEVDTDSTRSYGFNEAADIPGQLDMTSWVHALNYSCPFVPFPWPPIGRVNSGLLTTTKYTMSDDVGERISLPCPFSWPLRTANLKRCLLVTRLELPTGEELVLVNLHLEAYDDGAGKAAQTDMLIGLLEEEYAKGNYVIAAGDFNQTFPGGNEAYPVKNPELWTPGELDDSMLAEGWSFAYDTASPSCRLLNQPYVAESEATQYYVIDGFILSPNITCVSVETQDGDFAFSDHNPVKLEVAFNH